MLKRKDMLSPTVAAGACTSISIALQWRKPSRMDQQIEAVFAKKSRLSQQFTWVKLPCQN